MRVLFAIPLLLLSLAPVASAQEGTPVNVAMPEEQGLSEQLLLVGTLTARQDASLSSRAAGLVLRLHVDVGDEVKRGQALLELDTALAEHELAQRQATQNAARVARDEAMRQVGEAERLAGQKVFPQSELDLRRATLAQAEASLAQADAAVNQQREVLTRHTLTAPFDGIVSARQTEVGEYVELGTPVLRLVALSPLLLDVQMPQEYYPALSRLGRIAVRTDLQPDREIEAALVASVPVSDTSARSFLARLQVDSSLLLPGTSASATFYFEGANGAVHIVPPDALLRHPDGNFSLFTVRDNKAVRHFVKVGRSNEQGIEILGGLPAGEPVVVRGNEILQDGQSVRVTNQGE